MDTFTFKAIGTEWSISVDGADLDSKTKKEILKRVEKFEKQFSRFLPDSEVNSFRNAEAGLYPISGELHTLLKRADELREFTDGVFDPAVAKLLEYAGYDSDYSFKTDERTQDFKVPSWEIVSDSLKLDGATAFDLGGIGKGYCIDLVAEVLKVREYKYFMVEAGGDMYGTAKQDGKPWKVAIQYPGKEDLAAGVTHLLNEGIAVSDTFRRRWGSWNHIIDPKKRQSVENIIGAVALASTAWNADCMTSALFLGDREVYEEAAKHFNASYLVFYEDGTCLKSNNWHGELFS